MVCRFNHRVWIFISALVMIEERITEALQTRPMTKLDIQAALKLSCVDPINTIQVALIKLMRQGIVERVNAGVYRIKPPQEKSIKNNQINLFK